MRQTTQHEVCSMTPIRPLAPVVFCFFLLYALFAACATAEGGAHQANAGAVSVDWDQTIRQSATELTIQVCPQPPMRRGGPIHRQTHEALRDLKMRYAR